jgi:hypothetical protein
MAIAVIGGIAVSTALSLLVVPAFYLVTDRWLQRLKTRFRARKRGADLSQEPEPHPGGAE